MSGEQMWQKFCQREGIDPAVRHDIWKFCGGGPLADELAKLVLDGIKTATASLKLAYETEGEPIPPVGCYSVVLFDDDTAACVIRNSKVSFVPFIEVSAEHAFKEGEGDRSLEYWRTVHRQFFEPDFAAVGLPFDENEVCVLEEFQVVYREGKEKD